MNVKYNFYNLHPSFLVKNVLGSTSSKRNQKVKQGKAPKDKKYLKNQKNKKLKPKKEIIERQNLGLQRADGT